MTITILPDVTLRFILLFARIGTLVMLMPGLGEQSVPANIRLALALLLTLVFYPLAFDAFPSGLADDGLRLVQMVMREVIVGLAIGVLMRMMMALSQTAGAIIAQQAGLAFAQSVDPTMGQQGAVFGSFLGMTGVTLIFLTDLHHVAIAGLAGSYRVFPPEGFMPIGDFSELAVATVAGMFEVACQISAPFIVFGLVFHFALGLLAKLMPQLQVFFLAMPVTVFVGMMLFALLIIAMTTSYLAHVEEGLMRLVPG